MALVNSGSSILSADAGIFPVYNITAPTVIKATKGYIGVVSVIVAGSAAGTINDCAATANAAVGNQVGVIPNTVGVYLYRFPCATGITIVPGTGQTVAVSFV